MFAVKRKTETNDFLPEDSAPRFVTVRVRSGIWVRRNFFCRVSLPIFLDPTFSEALFGQVCGCLIAGCQPLDFDERDRPSVVFSNAPTQ